MTSRLTLSLIIPTKDRERILRQTLVTVFLQTRRPDELLIVDDGRMDGGDLCTWVEAHGIPCVYLRKETPGLVASRNLGVRSASGDIVLFLDDDVLLEPGYIAALVALFEQDADGSVGGATGALAIDYKPGVRAFLRFFLLDGNRPGAVLPSGSGVLVRQGEIHAPVPVQWLSGCNMAYRREVFDTFQFDQRLGPSYGWSDDLDLSHRVGQVWTLMATPEARLVHLKEPSGRINEQRFGFMETNYFYRFFAKNMPKRPKNLAALAWSLVGIMARNVLLLAVPSERAAAGQRLRGNLRGLVAIATGSDYPPGT